MDLGGHTVETAQSLDAQHILRPCIRSRLCKLLIYIGIILVVR